MMIRKALVRLRVLRQRRDGVTSIEYALLASLFVVTVSLFLPSISIRLADTYSKVTVALSPAPPPPPDN